MSGKQAFKMTRPDIRRLGRNGISILLALTMVFWQTPVYAAADSASDAASEAAATQDDSAERPSSASHEAESPKSGKSESPAADKGGSSEKGDKEGASHADAGSGEKASGSGSQASEDQASEPASAPAASGGEAAGGQAEPAATAKGAAAGEAGAGKDGAAGKAQVWTIRFDANGGLPKAGAAVDPVEGIREGGKAVKLPKAPFEREGYKFAGWNTLADPQADNADKRHAKFVPNGASLTDLSYSYVVLTEDNATPEELKDAVKTSDGARIAVVNAELKEGDFDAKGRPVSVCDLSDEAVEGTLTLYAQWREKKASDGAAVSGADSEEVVDDSNGDSDGEGEGESDDAVDEAGATAGEGEGEGDAEGASGLVPLTEDDLEAESTADEDGAVLDGASYIEGGDLSAAMVYGPAARNESSARKALGGISLLEADEALQAGEGLFPDAANATDADATDVEADATDADETPEVPRTGDGSQIEYISARWITEDTISNDDEAFLYVKPQKDETQTVRLQIAYALSGEHNYEPGDVTITVPAHIFKARDQNDYGNIIIPFPEDPSVKGDFNWKLIEDNYVLTNTKRMSAATKGYIQFAFTDMIPHELVDMQVSSDFDAYIEVVTHKQNVIGLRSNALRAQFDTQAEVTNVAKRVYGSPYRVKASTVSIPAALREYYANKYPNETEFIKVDWYAWGVTKANTMYTLDRVDSIPQDETAAGRPAVVVTETDPETGKKVQRTEADFDSFIVDATDLQGKELAQKMSYTGYLDGQTSYTNYSTVYPASQFQPDTLYTFHNDITFTVTEVDPDAEVTNPHVAGGPDEDDGVDPKLVTTVSTSAQTTYSYTNPVWYDPTGHFMVVKNGNDDKEQSGTPKYNYTHKASYGTGSYSDLHLWSWSPNGWYGIYPSAINELQDESAAHGVDGGIRLSYTIDSVGYVMPWMFQAPDNWYQDVTIDPKTGQYRLVANPDDKSDSVPSTRLSLNYRKPVTMVTEDTGVSIGRNGEKLAVGPDYEFVSIEFPGNPYVYSGVPQNINPDGSWEAITAGDGTFKYTRDSDKSHWPDITLEIQRGGAWQEYATASWKGGALAITPAAAATQAGAEIEGAVITVPADTQNFRTRVTLQNTALDSATNENRALQAAVDYDIRPVIRLKSTEAMMALISAAFEQTNTPEMFVYNGVNMKAYDAFDADSQPDREIVSIDKDGYDSIRGYTTDTMVYPKKSSRQSLRDADYENRLVTIHYSAQVEERSVINDKVTYEQAIADKRLVAETHGFWRDLLPKGVTPKLDTIKLRDGDTVVEAYKIENYKNTGRTMLVVEADLTPTPVRYRNGDIYYYEDIPSISFDAVYDFDSLIDYGDDIHNVIAFQSSNDHIGTVADYSGEADDPDYGGNVSSPRAFETNDPSKQADRDQEKRAMTDLDPDVDTPSFVYAATDTKIDIISAARTSLSKDLQVNNDGLWSTGVYYGNYKTAQEALAEKEAPAGNKRTVYEGGQYSYRLRMMSDTDTISKDLILYDSLENFYAQAESATGMDPHDTIDVDAPRWQGKLLGVDVSQLEAQGCAPVVYYSTVENLKLSDETDARQGIDTNMDLENRAIWVPAKEYAGSLDDVKAVAVDARKKADGSDFTLDPTYSVVVILRMQAPSGEAARTAIAADAHAYNNAYLKCTSINKDSGEVWGDSFVRKDYTKVGLMENNYQVTKVWNDDDNRDGKRPKSVTFTLYRDGQPVVETDAETGEGRDVTLTLPVTDPETGEQAWTGAFEHIPYTDPDGHVYRYTVKEDTGESADAGYTATSKAGEGNITFTNAHEPERISVSGTKSWVGDTPDARPEYIAVQLWANGKRQGAPKLVRPDTAGEWAYSFDNLYKYEAGEEIEYTVTETVGNPQTVGDKGNSYTSEIQGWDIVNTYHPKGDLVVTKEVRNTTDVSAQVEFPFTFQFTRTGDDGQPVPVFDEYDYWIQDKGADAPTAEDEPTGKVATNDVVSIRGDQQIYVRDVDEYVTYTVTEESQPGFTQVIPAAGEPATGTVLPNETVQSDFVNEYAATGSLSLKAEKTLLNRELRRYQFRFEAYRVLTDANGNTTEELVRTASNGAPDDVVYREDGTIESSHAPVIFGSISFTQADANAQAESGKPYTYKIKEVSAGRDGYTYDSSQYLVDVSVSDNGDGTLAIEAVPQHFFCDTCDGKGYLSGKYSSVLLNGDPAIQAPYSLRGIDLGYLRYNYDAAVVNAYEAFISRAAAIADDVKYSDYTDANEYYPGYSFSATYISRIEFKGIDPELEELYARLVAACEGKGSASVSGSDAVIEQGIGRVVVEFDYAHTRGPSSLYACVSTLVYPACDVCDGVGETGAEKVTFENSYVAAGETTLRAWKDVKGRKLKTGEYSFELVDEAGEVIRTAKNGADGSVEFGALSYSEKDIGKTFNYSVREVAGNDYTVNYDTHVYGYTVMVYDNGDGTLSVSSAPATPVLTGHACETCDGLGYLADSWVSGTGGDATLVSNSVEELNVAKSVANGEGIMALGSELFMNQEAFADAVYALAQRAASLGEVSRDTYRADWSTYHYGFVNIEYISAVNFIGRDSAIDSLFQTMATSGTIPWLSYDTFFTNDQISKFANGVGRVEYRVSSVGERGPAVYAYNDLKIYPTCPECKGVGETYEITDWDTEEGDLPIFTNTLKDGSLVISKAIESANSANQGEEFNFHVRLLGSGIDGLDLQYTTTEIEDETKQCDECDGRGVIGIDHGVNWADKENQVAYKASNKRFSGTGTSENAAKNSISVADPWDKGSKEEQLYRLIRAYGTPQVETHASDYDFYVYEAIGNYGDLENLFKAFDVRSSYRNPDGYKLSSTFPYAAVDRFVYGVRYLRSGPHKNAESPIQDERGNITGWNYEFQTDVSAVFYMHPYGNRCDVCGGTGTIDVHNVTTNSVGVDYSLGGEGENRTVDFDVALKGGDAIILPGIPAGTAYQVYEDTPDGWVLVEQSNASGVIQPLEVASAAFKNKYQPGKTSVQFSGTKTLDGSAAQAGAFSFELLDETGKVLQTAQTSDGGFIQFEPIEYTTDNAGTHAYTIREVLAGDNQIDYDTHAELVSVTVTALSKDKVTATVQYDNDGIAFANKTRPGNLTITKQAEGLTEANKDDEFTFEISLNNEKGMPFSSDDKIYWYIDGQQNGASSSESQEQSANGKNVDGNLSEAGLFNPLAAIASLFAPEKAYAATGVFHATPDMLQGTAYAIITTDGELVLFRSYETYQSVWDTGNYSTTVTDIKGNTYTGTVFAGVEKGGSNPPWVHKYGSNTSNYLTRSNLSTAAYNNVAVARSFKVASGQAIRPKTCEAWFWGVSYIENYDFSRFDTSAVTSMHSMFYTAKGMSSLDLSGFDTSSVTDMGYMFYYCSSITSLDVSSFNTSKVTNMDYMFGGHPGNMNINREPSKNGVQATYLDVSGFDTSNVTSMRSMFSGCTQLAALDVSHFVTSKVRNYGLQGMFAMCENLQSLNLQGFDSTHVNSDGTAEMMYGCSKLSSVTLGDSFSFKGGSRKQTFPEAPETDGYTGKWINLDNGEGPFINKELEGQSALGVAGEWVWQDQRYYVTFNPNGGYSSVQRMAIEDYPDGIIMPNKSSVQFPHYSLKGWSTNSDGSGEFYAPDSVVTGLPSKNITFYAQWDPSDLRKYRVEHYQQSFDLSEYALAATDVYEEAVGKKVIPQIRDDYSSQGFISPEPKSAEVLDDDSLVVKYYYDRIQYDIAFDGNGATSGQMNPQHMVYQVAQPLNANSYQRVGYFFTGWNTKADGTGESYPDGATANFTAENGVEIRLYAQWVENPNETWTPAAGQIRVTLHAGETLVLPDLPAGTSYSVREVDNPSGWEQSGVVGEAGVIDPNTTKAATFTNTYSATGVAQITAHKALDGESIADGQFEFELTPVDGAPLNGLSKMTATNGAVDDAESSVDDAGASAPNAWQGTAPVAFDAITYTQPGTYRYKIHELARTDDGVEYDSHEEDVTVTVTDAGHGVLATSVEYDSDGALFANSMKPGSLQVKKLVVDSPDAPDDAEFNFQLELADRDGVTLPDAYQATKYSADYSFEKSEENVVKYSHTPNVDDSGNATGTYANNLAVNDIVKIEGANSLHIKVWYSTESVSYDWLAIYPKGIAPDRNNYSSATISSGKLGGGASNDKPTSASYIKEYDVPGDTAQFFFRSDGSVAYYGYYAIITAVTEKTVQTGTSEDVTVSSGDTLKLKAGEWIDIEGLPHGASYSVTELNLPEGWKQVSADGAEGTIEAAKTSVATITNKYEPDEPGPPPEEPKEYTAEGAVTLQAHKTVKNGILKDDDGFAFRLLDAEGTQLQVKGVDSLGGTQSVVTFDPITYAKDDADKTFYYTIREVAGGDSDVTYDSAVYTAKVVVTDKGDGTLATDVSYYEGDAAQVVDAEEAIAKLEAEKAELASDKGLVDEQLQTAESLKDDLEEQLGEARAAKEALDSSAEDYEAKLASVYDQIASLESQIASLESQISAADKKIAQYTQKLDAIQADIDSLDKQIEAAQDGLSLGDAVAEASFTNVFTTGVSFTKAWDDADDQDGYRPMAEEFAAKVQLLADGETVTDAEPTVVDNEDGTYSISYSGLPKFDSATGKAIAYTLAEGTIEHYTADASSVPARGTLTNSHAPEITSVSATKQWADDADRDGLRPSAADYAASVHLLANGEEVTDAQPIVVASAANTYTVTFENLPKKANGTDITYTIREDVIEGYTATVAGKDADTVAAGGTLVNTHEPAKTELSFTKAWDDADDKDGLRPSAEEFAAKLHLKANGTDVEGAVPSVVDNEDGTYSISYRDLPVKQGGENIEYTLSEDAIAGYNIEGPASVAPGGTMTNKHEPATATVELRFDKYLFGASASDDLRFDFTLTPSDAQGNPLQADDQGDASGAQPPREALTVQNGAFEDGLAEVAFSVELPVDDADYYFVAEESPVDSVNVVTDEARYLVHVSVAGGVATTEYFFLDEDGQAEAVDEPAFYNNIRTSSMSMRFRSMSMTAQAASAERVSVYPRAMKYVDGSTASLLGNDFSFTLTGQGVNRTKANDITGNVAFYDEGDSAGLVFDEPGTYTYRIAENIPAGATRNSDGSYTADGIIYDGATITLTVTVTDNDGVLSARSVYTGMSQGSAPAFYNKRVAESTVKNPELYLTVDKLAFDTHEYVSGAKLAVLRAGSNVVIEQWTSGSAAHRLGAALEPGKSYVLRELAAPDGFELIDDVEFTVASDGSGIAVTSKGDSANLRSATRIQLFDPRSPETREELKTITRTTRPDAASGKAGDTVPKTGDRIDLSVIWTLLAIALMAAFLAVPAWRRSRRR